MKVGQPGFPCLDLPLMLTFRKGSSSAGHIPGRARSHSSMAILIRTSFQRALVLFSPPLDPALFLSQICTRGNVHQSTRIGPLKVVNGAMRQQAAYLLLTFRFGLYMCGIYQPICSTVTCLRMFTRRCHASVTTRRIMNFARVSSRCGNWIYCDYSCSARPFSPVSPAPIAGHSPIPRT